MSAQQIYKLLELIMGKNMVCQKSNHSQKIKDDVKRITGESLDLVLKETSPQRINQLIAQEFKKNYVKTKL